MTNYWGILAGIASGLFSGLAGRYVEEWLSRPRLKVDFVPSEGGFQTEAKWEKDGTEFVEIYIRARVQNRWGHVAKQCRAYLVKLEEVHSPSTKATEYHDSLVLRWPAPGGGDYLPRDIPRGVNQFFDVVGVFKHSPSEWRFGFKERFSEHDELRKRRGRYRFTVLVTGDGVKPAGRKIDVIYEGRSDNLKTFNMGPFPPLRWWNILGHW